MRSLSSRPSTSLGRRVVYSSLALLGVGLVACGSSPTDAPASEKPAASSDTAAAPGTPTFEEWRRVMAKTPTPGEGCFQATHPSMTWVKSSCMTPPAVPYAPRAGGASQNVGNGTDLSAEVSGTMSWAEGSFPIVSGVTSETDGSSNNYSLQLNTNTFSGATPCGSISGCQGWEQFIYVPGGGFIQYWLLGYNTTCPSGWNTYGGDCWKNIASGVSVPSEPISNLTNMTVTGTAGSSDEVTVTVGDGNIYKASQASVLNLSAGWKAAEFNVIGNANSSEAVFNQGASVFVQITTDSAPATTSAPTCESAGFTGETNNMNLVTNSCATFGGGEPAITFLESSATRTPNFQSLSSSQVAVLGSNGNLWLESGPFGTVPPSRTQVDGDVASFSAISASQMLVLGADGNLWLENAPFGSVPPARSHVDGSVSKFANVGAGQIAVLGSNGNLWLETGSYTDRVQIDGAVANFAPISASQFVVLGTDGNLWLENGPFGTVPPARNHVDGSVASFQALDANDLLVLDTSGDLWLEHGPFTSGSYASRAQIDGSVVAYQALNTSQVYVLGSDGKLWFEQAPFGTVPPARQQIDGAVFSFRAVDASDVLVLGMNGNLWYEHGPYTTVPPTRQEVDSKVSY